MRLQLRHVEHHIRVDHVARDQVLMLAGPMRAFQRGRVVHGNAKLTVWRGDCLKRTVRAEVIKDKLVHWPAAFLSSSTQCAASLNRPPEVLDRDVHVMHRELLNHLRYMAD